MGHQSRFYLIWRIEKESVCCYFSRLVINHKYTRGLNFYRPHPEQQLSQFGINYSDS